MDGPTQERAWPPAMVPPGEGDRVRLADGREITFRQLGDPVPSWSLPGVRWAVECWDEGVAYPVGQAWVMDAYGGHVDWLCVQEWWRRKGVATALLRVILERWPDCAYAGVTPEGEAFVGWFDAVRK